MKSTIKRWLSITLALIVGGMMILPVAVYADASKDICEGVGGTSAGGSGCTPPAGSKEVTSVVPVVVNILSFIVGVAAVIMLIIGGLKYITSSGDPNSISSAKNTILYAIIGLIVAAFAQGIVRFALTKTKSAPPAGAVMQILHLPIIWR